MATEETTALLGLGSDDADTDEVDAAFELFILELADSPVLAEADVEKLIMRFAGVDELGPLVFTMIVYLEDLEAALASGDDLAEDRLAMQIERP